MQKWIDVTDKLLEFRDKKVLKNSGKISHKKALEKANEEYENLEINKINNIFLQWKKCILDI